MYAIVSDKFRRLYQEITPWIIGTKGAAEDFAPIFKDDTPDNIVKKYEELKKEAKTELS